MCKESERLVGYVYEESDAAERASVEAHLAACAECRHEVAALRAVRQDLLAWEVPDHESVWRPFVPTPPRPSWRDLPASLLAAAAGLVFMVGMAGGAAAGAWRAPAAPVTAETTAADPVTAEDLARIEAAIRAELQAEMARALAARVEGLEREHQAVLARLDAPAAPRPDVAAALASLTSRLDRTDEFLSKQASWAAEIEDRTMRTWNAMGVSRAPALPNVNVMPVGYGGASGR